MYISILLLLLLLLLLLQLVKPLFYIKRLDDSPLETCKKFPTVLNGLKEWKSKLIVKVNKKYHKIYGILVIYQEIKVGNI